MIAIKSGFISTFVIAVAAIFALTSGAQATNDQERVLFSFPADGSTGANPNSGVTSWNGDIYGTTRDGGKHGFGVVFKLHHGKEKVLHSFGVGGDYGYPYGRLVIDAAGNIFGGTEGGTVYKLASNGLETVLHTFSGGGDGYGIVHGLAADADGNLYGTTEEGGSSSRCENGCGTIFKVTPAGEETVLYSLGKGGESSTPKAGVTLDAEGNIYGTTYLGGANNRGTIFKLTPDGQFSVLYSFGEGHPVTGVVLDESGNLYGTTLDFFGNVYKLASDGTYTVVYDFVGGEDGQGPQELIRDEAGNLYGVAGYPDQVYKLAPDGTKTTLYVFTGGADGATPDGPLFMDPVGNLYGTTYWQGGGSGCVFKVLSHVN